MKANSLRYSGLVYLIGVVLLMLLISLTSQATNYYISATGSDSNSGLTELLPKQTLTAVNALTLNAGDTVAFKKGDGWYGQLLITRSGSVGNPIVYTTYGTGTMPTITGFTTASGWTNLGSNIWESSAVSSLTTCNMVAVNGVNTAMGRYPNGNAANSGYLTFQTHAGSTSITSSSLTGTPDWTGAEVVIRPNRWILNRCVISSNSGSTLVFSPATAYSPIDGFGFFIQNDARTLDQQNEWYFNPTNDKIKIYSTTEPSNVKVATIEDLCTITASYITIDGLAFTGANDEGITGNSTVRNGITIQNCSVSLIGGDAITGINCENFILDGNTISNINNNGISGGTADHVTITDNTIINQGVFPGMGTLIYSGISTGENANVLISRNSLSNVGYNGISFYGDSTSVKNNSIDTYCFILDDGGGVYTYTGTRTKMTNDTIYGNIVVNGLGALDGSTASLSTSVGIYLDDNSKNVEVAYNTIGNTDTYGMLLNNPNAVNIHNNTFYNNTPALRITDFDTSQDVVDNIISNNIFFSKESTQEFITFVSTQETLLTFATLDNNTYARPMLNTGNMFLTKSASTDYLHRDFASWKTLLSQDTNSTLSTKSVTTTDDIYFQYNETGTAKTVINPYPSMGMDGTIYTSSINIPAYSGLVSLKYIINPSGANRPIMSGGKVFVFRNGSPLVL